MDGVRTRSGDAGRSLDAVLDVHTSTRESTSRTVRDAIASQLATAPYLKESNVLAMCERLALP